MSNFFKNSITMKGAVAIAAIISGKKMEFTRMAVGDGNLSGGQTPMTMTGLVHPLFDVNIHEIYYDSESQVTIKGSFSNKDLQTGFFYRELGLFATDPVTGEEILFCYGNAGENAEWINPAGEGSVIEKEVHIVTLVGNAENVSCTIKSGIYPSIEQVQTWLGVKADLDATAEEGGRVVPEQMRFDHDQTLYVDAGVAHTGDGSEAKPFKTIQEAINARYLGASVIYIKIKPGTYAEDISTPRAPGTTWRLIREGEGVVSIRSAVFDNCMYLRLQGLTFVGPMPENSTLIYVANTPSVNFDKITINGSAKATGVNFSTSCGVLNDVVVNNCGIGIAATSGAYVDLRNTSGTGNEKGLHADGGIIVADWFVPDAKTPYEKVNGGVINVYGGASTFPSNFCPMHNLGDFTDAATLKTAILTEFKKLGVGEARACWFANNIGQGFGPFGSGQRMQVQIIRSTDSGSGYGTALFTSHHNAARGYMQIQDGAFATDAPVKFADAVDLTKYLPLAGGEMGGEIRVNGDRHFPAIKNTSGGELWLFDKDDERYKGGFILRAISTDGNNVVTDLEGHFGGTLQWGGLNIARSVNGYNADEFGAITIPTATASTYGVVKVANGDMVIDPDANDAAITPAVYHDVSDFRHKNTAYNVGDKVECMFNHELWLECTKAGTTSAKQLDTRNVTHGQVLTDGGVQWTVQTHIVTVNGQKPGADGNVQIPTTDESLIKQIVLDTFFPVGSTYISADENFNPNIWGGTWVKVENRFLLGSGSRGIGAQGGEENVTLSVDQIPSHTHNRGTMNISGKFGVCSNNVDTEWNNAVSEDGNAFYKANGYGDGNRNPSNTGNGGFGFNANRSWSGSSAWSGGSGAHNNMPPYEVVNIWKRTI